MCRKAGIRIWVRLLGARSSNILGAKTFKIWHDFGQLSTSITNISGTDEDIGKRKTAFSTTVPPVCDEKDFVNFVPLKCLCR